MPSGERRTVRTPKLGCNSLCQASLKQRIGTARKFVGHYLPWFLGNNVDEACTRSGPDCPYKNDHWCSSYGNSYYASYLGAYDITGPNVIETQLDLMKASGLDGLWIDYQMPTWDAVVDRIVAGLKVRGMGFAIMVDSATFSDVMETTAEKVTNWTQEPHYYRHQGLPIIPVWNNDDTIFFPLPVNAIYITRYEFDPPEWASDTYTWVQDDYLVRPGRRADRRLPNLSSVSMAGTTSNIIPLSLRAPHSAGIVIATSTRHSRIANRRCKRSPTSCVSGAQRDATGHHTEQSQAGNGGWGERRVRTTLHRLKCVYPGRLAARQHRPEYVQLVTWNDPWLRTFGGFRSPLFLGLWRLL